MEVTSSGKYRYIFRDLAAKAKAFFCTILCPTKAQVSVPARDPFLFSRSNPVVAVYTVFCLMDEYFFVQINSHHAIWTQANFMGMV